MTQPMATRAQPRDGKHGAAKDQMNGTQTLKGTRAPKATRADDKRESPPAATREATQQSHVANKVHSTTNASPVEPETQAQPLFALEASGVYALKYDGNGNVSRRRVCAPLEIVSEVRDEAQHGWGWHVRWKDRDGHKHETIVDAEALAAEPQKAVAELLSRGLSVVPKGAADVVAYLQTSTAKERRRRIRSPGWNRDRSVYVMANGKAFGASGEEFVYLPSTEEKEAFRSKGTLSEWRKRVAALCVGNSRYAFAVSASFAGPILQDAGVDGGGFHFMGESSTGKTRLLYAAQSVWGARSGLVSWQSTRNAMGALAAARNDGVLVIDEVGQANPKDFGTTIYDLANGTEKARANKDGSARESRRWRLMLLSTGEKDIETMIGEGGKRAKAGQDARLATIPSDAGRGHGVFEELHEHANGAALAGTFARVTSETCGSAGRAWLTYLSGMPAADRVARVREGVASFVRAALDELGSPVGEVHRVLERFAVVAVAGELATEAGVTGWAPGTATRAVQTCMRAWLAHRGGVGSSDRRRLLGHVRLVIETRWSCFEATAPSAGGGLYTSSVAPPPVRLGFRTVDGRTALVEPETFRTEFARDYAPKVGVAAQWLRDAGWLLPGDDDEHATQRRRIDGAKRRFFVLDLERVRGDELD